MSTSAGALCHTVNVHIIRGCLPYCECPHQQGLSATLSMSTLPHCQCPPCHTVNVQPAILSMSTSTGALPARTQHLISRESSLDSFPKAKYGGMWGRSHWKVIVSWRPMAARNSGKQRLHKNTSSSLPKVLARLASKEQQNLSSLASFRFPHLCEAP